MIPLSNKHEKVGSWDISSLEYLIGNHLGRCRFEPNFLKVAQSTSYQFHFFSGLEDLPPSIQSMHFLELPGC